MTAGIITNGPSGLKDIIKYNCTCEAEDITECVGIAIGVFGCIMENTQLVVQYLLFEPLTSTWFLPIALFLCLQYYYARFDFTRLAGKQLVILWIYYGEYWRKGNNANGNAFTYTCFFLLLEEVILYYPLNKLFEKFEEMIEKRDPWFIPARLKKKFEYHHKFNAQQKEHFEEIRDNEKEESTDTAFNIYMDLRKPWRKALLTFIAQFGLVWFYVLEMNGGSDDNESPGRSSHHIDQFSLLKWGFSVVLIYVSGEDESGPACKFTFWKNQFEKFEKSRDCVSPLTFNPFDEKQWRKFVTCRCPPWHILWRFSFDFVINSLARSIIRGTASIMLAVEGPLDFVKDATALFFIMKLDDWEYEVNLGAVESWDFSKPDTGYTVQDFVDPLYQVTEKDKNLIGEQLGFPTAVDIVNHVWETNKEELKKKKEKAESLRSTSEKTSKSSKGGSRSQLRVAEREFGKRKEYQLPLLAH